VRTVNGAGGAHSVEVTLRLALIASLCRLTEHILRIRIRDLRARGRIP
jgi:hypothetical protein